MSICKSLPRMAALAAIHASTAIGTPPLDVTVEVERPVVQVGQPLTFEMTVRNDSGQPLGQASLYSDGFSLIYYPGLEEEGCELHIAVPNPLPGNPNPDLFGYTWLLPALVAGESVKCKATFPMTLRPGTETINLTSIINGISRPEASFTYTLVAAPQPVPASSPLALIVLTLLFIALLPVHLRRLPQAATTLLHRQSDERQA